MHRLKLMIYRIDPNDRTGREDGFAVRKREIERVVADYPSDAAGTQPAQWLFVAIPYYWGPWPKCGVEAHVQLYTLTTPSDSPSLVKPDWDIWQRAGDIEEFFSVFGVKRSLDNSIIC